MAGGGEGGASILLVMLSFSLLLLLLLLLLHCWWRPNFQTVAEILAYLTYVKIINCYAFSRVPSFKQKLSKGKGKSPPFFTRWGDIPTLLPIAHQRTTSLSSVSTGTIPDTVVKKGPKQQKTWLKSYLISAARPEITGQIRRSHPLPKVFL